MLEWWSKRPVWQCVTALAVGWLFLGGLGPLVMIPLTGMCIFPPVWQAIEDPEGFKTKLKGTLKSLIDGLSKALDKDDDHHVEHREVCRDGCGSGHSQGEPKGHEGCAPKGHDDCAPKGPDHCAPGGHDHSDTGGPAYAINGDATPGQPRLRVAPRVTVRAVASPRGPAERSL